MQIGQRLLIVPDEDGAQLLAFAKHGVIQEEPLATGPLRDGTDEKKLIDEAAVRRWETSRSYQRGAAAALERTRGNLASTPPPQ